MARLKDLGPGQCRERLQRRLGQRPVDRMAGDMDVNCGRVLDEGLSIRRMGDEIFELILATASGQKTKSELAEQGQWEFHPWYVGAVV